MRGTTAVIAGLASLALAGQAQAATFDANVGPPKTPSVRQADFDQFFPRTISIHVGDTVRWTFRGVHTVTFLGGAARPPLIVADPADPVTGKRDAAGRLFWFNGLPNLIMNPVAAFPSGDSTYDGIGYRNSGMVSTLPATYSLTFTKAGTYRYVCLMHPGMDGTVRVLPVGQPVPTQAQDNAAGMRQFNRDEKVARALARIRPAGNTVLVGPEQGTVYLMAMAPAVKTIHVGDTVTFEMRHATAEVHTVTIGPEAYTSQLEQTFISPQPNPAGPPSLVVNPLDAYPSNPSSGTLIYNGRNHGNGFLNSGLLDNDPTTPNPSEFKVKFTRPGRYHYECVIHPNMDGTIVVLPRPHFTG